MRWLIGRDDIHFRPEKMIYELHIVIRTEKISNFGQINKYALTDISNQKTFTEKQ